MLLLVLLLGRSSSVPEAATLFSGKKKEAGEEAGEGQAVQIVEGQACEGVYMRSFDVVEATITMLEESNGGGEGLEFSSPASCIDRLHTPQPLRRS